MPRPVVVFRSLEEVEGGFGPCALSIGNFDGVHAGHRQILRRVVELARERGWRPSVMTFDPHPARVVNPQRAPRLLTTPEERARLMAEEGVEQVLVLPFTAEFSRISPEEFVRDLLVGRLDVRAVLVGSNFRFGYRHAGDTARLAELGAAFGVETVAIPAVRMRGLVISSSEIRKLIEAGRVAKAGRLLERPYALSGDVVQGEGIGSKQTVPTLNLRTAAEVLPASGVYVTRAQDNDGGRSWPAVTNVGFRPTFGGSTLTVETYLLGPFDGDTPRHLRVVFLRRLREERRFDSPEALKTQILRDVNRARAYWRRMERIGCYTQEESQIPK